MSECCSQTESGRIRLLDLSDWRLHVGYLTQTSNASELSDHLGQTISDAIRHLVALLMHCSVTMLQDTLQHMDIPILQLIA